MSNTELWIHVTSHTSFLAWLIALSIRDKDNWLGTLAMCVIGLDAVVFGLASLHYA